LKNFRFQISDFFRRRKNETMTHDPVDFVGIGAPKCGTTWISECLAEHPEIGFAADKEVYFFADSEARTYANAGFDNYSRGTDWYHDQMPHDKPGARVFGEYSVSYMYDARVCQRLAQYHPQVKIVIALRNPVDMVYSWYWFNRTGLIAKLPETFEQAMEIDYFRNLGCYHLALAPFFAQFDRRQLHVVLHEDIQRDATRVLRELFAFLDVDPEFQPEKTGVRVNAAKGTRFGWMQSLGGTTYGAMKKIPGVSSIVSSRSFEKAVLAVYRRVNHVPLDYPPMDPATREQLAAYYAEDTQKLATLIGRDLDHWDA